MWRNPISDKRRPIIRQMLFKHLVREHNHDYAEFSQKPNNAVELVSKTKVGPFKIRVFLLDNGRYFITGPLAGWLSGYNEQEYLIEYQRAIEKLEGYVSEIEAHVDGVVDSIAQADPTGSGEYSAWLAKLHNDYDIRLPEDIGKINEDLRSYDDLKRRGIIPPHNRDIHTFMTYGSFFETLRAYGGVKSDRERLLEVMKSGKEIYRNDTFHVIEVREWELAKNLAKGTAWCVRGTDMAQHYLRRAESYPLYFFFKENEQHALLTNLPDERQFMDTSDSPIRKQELEADKDFYDAVSGLADWVICESCGTIYAKHDNDPVENFVLSVRSSIELMNTGIPILGSGVTFGSNAYMIFALPPEITKHPVIASREALRNKILIGPAEPVLQRYGEMALFPAIGPFFDRAGYSEHSTAYLEPIARSILNTWRCDCGTMNTEMTRRESLAELLHVLYVMQPCEDFGITGFGYVVCGHEISPKYRGPSCPPRMMDYGKVIGMRCECGAYVPKGGSSICPACMHGLSPEESEVYVSEDCPICELRRWIHRNLNNWKRSLKSSWKFHYEKERRVWYEEVPETLPTWNDFHYLHDILVYSEWPDETYDEYMSQFYSVLEAIKQQGYFDKTILAEVLIPMLEDLQQQTRDDHPCKDDY